MLLFWKQTKNKETKKTIPQRVKVFKLLQHLCMICVSLWRDGWTKGAKHAQRCFQHLLLGSYCKNQQLSQITFSLCSSLTSSTLYWEWKKWQRGTHQLICFQHVSFRTQSTLRLPGIFWMKCKHACFCFLFGGAPFFHVFSTGLELVINKGGNHTLTAYFMILLQLKLESNSRQPAYIIKD